MGKNKKVILPDPTPSFEPVAAPTPPEPEAIAEPIKPVEYDRFLPIKVSISGTTIYALVIPGKGVFIAARGYGMCFAPAITVNGDKLK